MIAEIVVLAEEVCLGCLRICLYPNLQDSSGQLEPPLSSASISSTGYCSYWILVPVLALLVHHSLARTRGIWKHSVEWLAF